VAFLSGLQGARLDTSRVRLHEAPRLSGVRRLPAPPRVTCQSRLYPPPEGATVRTATGAITAFDDVWVRRDLYAPDLVEGWPEVLPLADAMLLAHEMVHVWQWQHRDLTGYTPLKAAFEHVRTADPYLFDLDTSVDYLDYGYEQQGSIMEEYLCCRTLAPRAARTGRLHAMLSEYFPLRPLEEPMSEWVRLPWDGVDVEGICDGGEAGAGSAGGSSEGGAPSLP
jgi:hypothetical protein